MRLVWLHDLARSLIVTRLKGSATRLGGGLVEGRRRLACRWLVLVVAGSLVVVWLRLVVFWFWL